MNKEMKTLEIRFDEIYNKKKNTKFFVFPFFEILSNLYERNTFIWMNDRMMSSYKNIVEKNNIQVRDELTIENFYFTLYQDKLTNHNNNFNSSHAISHNITRYMTWLSDFIEYKSFNNDGSLIPGGKGAFKPIYKIKDDKIEVVREFVKIYKEKHEDDIKLLIESHKNKPEDENEDNLSSKIKNIILYGPPGTGKTFLHKYLINIIEQNDNNDLQILNAVKNDVVEENDDFIDELKSRIIFITFHQSYSYEDFIEGFRPSENNNSINIGLKEGSLKVFVDSALDDPDNNYYLIIDEINRGNISKIFGELITLIEEDKRNEEWAVNLPYSNERFYVPDNLYIIGTMNTADKSIANIDVALRRRFTFVRMDPKPALLPKNEIKTLTGFSNLKGDTEPKTLQEWFILLNNYIKDTRGEDYQIGHSYFMKIKTKEDLEFILEYKIKPLLEEYFYHESADELDKIKNYCSIELMELEEESKEKKNENAEPN